MIKKYDISVVRLLSFHFLFLLQMYVFADTLPADEQSVSLQTPEIIEVTANRKVQDLQDISSFLTVLNDDLIGKLGVTDLTHIELVSAGLRLGRSGDELRPAMRGARTNEVGVAGTGIAEQIVGIFIDEVYVPTTTAALGALIDVERIEVLRGPQGTLYGRNTYAGSINILTRQPVLDELSGETKVAFGNFEHRMFQGAANIPLSDKFASRLVFASEKRNGLIKNLHTVGTEDDLREKDHWLLRGTTLWQKDDHFEASLRLEYTEKDANSDAIWGYQQFAGYQIAETQQGSGQFHPTANVTPGHIYLPNDASNTDKGPYRVYRNAQSFSRQQHFSSNFKAVWHLSNIDVNWISAFNDFSARQFYDNDYSDGGIDVVGGFGRQDDQETFSTELKLNSNDDGDISWIGGLYWYRQEADWEWLWREDSNADGVADSIIVPSWGNPQHAPHTVSSVAAYGQLNFDLFESLRLITGLRFQQDEKTFTGEQVSRWQDDALLYRAALEIDISDNHMLYGSMANGYRTGGANDVRVVARGADTHYDNESVTTYELGMNNMFQPNLTLNAAAFLSRYKDVKAQLFAVACNDTESGLSVLACVEQNTSTTFEYYENGGNIEAYGLELDARWQATDNLALNLTVALLQSKFQTGFKVGNRELRPYLGLGNYEQRQNINDPGSQFDYSGWQPAMSPDFNISLSGTYTIVTESAGDISAFLVLNVVDDYFAFDTNLPEVLVDQHIIANAQLLWNISPSWQIAVNAYNITNETIMTRAVVHSQIVNGLPANSVQANWNDPSTYNLEMRYRF